MEYESNTTLAIAIAVHSGFIRGVRVGVDKNQYFSTLMVYLVDLKSEISFKKPK